MNAQKYDEPIQYKFTWNDQHNFLHILHHDTIRYGGWFCTLNSPVNGIKYRKWAKDSSFPLLSKIKASVNTYVSLNSFTKNDAHKENIRAISSVYLDLDCHKGTQAEIERKIRRTLTFLKEKYADNVLPAPTMITNSGRGLGIFYVLDRSIAASINSTQKQVRFWQYLCEAYSKKYEKMLSDANADLLEVDHKVIGDVTRVVRLPATPNHSTPNKKLCKMVYTNIQNGTPVYYSLKELARYVDYKKYKNSDEKKELTKHKVIRIDALNKSYLLTRIKRLERTQAYLIDRKNDCREQMCFIWYNTLVQITDRQSAKVALYDFNAKFTFALRESELKNIFRSVDNCKGPEGEIRGYYLMSDNYIIRTLGLKQKVSDGILTQEQYDKIGFGLSTRAEQRAEKKATNKAKREEREKEIIDYIINNPSVSYADAAVLFGCSLRTIKNYVKKHNVHRYSKDTAISEAVSDCIADDELNAKIISIPTSIHSEVPDSLAAVFSVSRMSHNYKVQKFVTKSGGVIITNSNYNIRQGSRSSHETRSGTG